MKKRLFIALSLILFLRFLPSDIAYGRGTSLSPKRHPIPRSHPLTQYDASCPSTGSTWYISQASADLVGPYSPKGPAQLSTGQVENIPGSDPVVGGVHAIVAHPTNANILDWNKRWNSAEDHECYRRQSELDSVSTDQFPSLSIGALELDPTDLTFRMLVAGMAGTAISATWVDP